MIVNGAAVWRFRFIQPELTPVASPVALYSAQARFIG